MRFQKWQQMFIFSCRIRGEEAGSKYWVLRTVLEKRDLVLVDVDHVHLYCLFFCALCSSTPSVSFLFQRPVWLWDWPECGGEKEITDIQTHKQKSCGFWWRCTSIAEMQHICYIQLRVVSSSCKSSPRLRSSGKRKLRLLLFTFCFRAKDQLFISISIWSRERPCRSCVLRCQGPWPDQAFVVNGHSCVGSVTLQNMSPGLLSLVSTVLTNRGHTQ